MVEMLPRLSNVTATSSMLKGHVVDITDADAVAELANVHASEVDILVLCAGISQELSLVNEPNIGAQIHEVDVNLIGTMRMVDAFLPHLRKRDEAAIVIVSSAIAFVPDASRPIYSATKAAQHAYAQALRHQLAQSSVRVFELMPPLTDTPMAVDVQDVPKLSPERLSAAFLRGLRDRRLEITPGLASTVRTLSRVAPGYLFRKLNSR